MFVGNSASYFYFAVSNQRTSYLIPISGRYLINGRLRADPQKLKKFEEVYLLPIVTKAFNEKKRIVIIDHSGSGKSVDAFNWLLKKNCPTCGTGFVNLITKTLGDTKIHQHETI